MYAPFYDGNYNYWFWGLEDYNRLSFNTERIDILIVGIIIGLLILICGIILLYSANLVRTEKKSFKEQNKIWIRVPLLTIFGAITWIIYIAILGDGYFIPSGYNVWDYFYIGFGLTGAISGGILPMLGFFFNKVIRETNAMSYFVTTPREEIIVLHKKFPPPIIQKTQRLGTLNYCPRCRFKVDETYKFCPGCGFKF